MFRLGGGGGGVGDGGVIALLEVSDKRGNV